MESLKRQKNKGIFIKAADCKCGKINLGFWCKNPQFIDSTEYICNACYDLKRMKDKKKIVFCDKNFQIDLFI